MLRTILHPVSTCQNIKANYDENPRVVMDWRTEAMMVGTFFFGGAVFGSGICWAVLDFVTGSNKLFWTALGLY